MQRDKARRRRTCYHTSVGDRLWTQHRDALRDSRARAMASIAAALGCVPEALPFELQRAVLLHGHESYQIALTPLERSEVPTRVDRPSKRAR